jgi:hypothetical protein
MLPSKLEAKLSNTKQQKCSTNENEEASPLLISVRLDEIDLNFTNWGQKMFRWITL